MATPLIGLAGAARSGKDTAAQALLDSGWTRRAFADQKAESIFASFRFQARSATAVEDEGRVTDCLPVLRGYLLPATASRRAAQASAGFPERWCHLQYCSCC